MVYMKSADLQRSQSTTTVSLVAWIQRCCKAFTLTFIALVLMTIGFCLIMAGWFTPPTNDSVHHVRLAGPIAFSCGCILLIFSCLVCGIEQRRCCMRCTTEGRDHTVANVIEARGREPTVISKLWSIDIIIFIIYTEHGDTGNRVVPLPRGLRRNYTNCFF